MISFNMHSLIQSFKKSIFILTFSFFLFPFSLIPAQTLTGPTGLFTIPNAEVINDGQISFGINLLPKKYLEYSNYNYDAGTFAVNVGYLPFLELTFRATRQLNLPSYNNHVMDRYIGVKVRVLEQDELLPSISLGVNNPINTGESARHFNATYIVFTKTYPFNEAIEIESTLGYGSDIIKAVDYQFVGIFGGISLNFNTSQFLNSRISLMAEYDAERFNSGIRLTLFNHINILAGLMGMDSFSGGVSTMWEL